MNSMTTSLLAGGATIEFSASNVTINFNLHNLQLTKNFQQTYSKKFLCNESPNEIV